MESRNFLEEHKYFKKIYINLSKDDKNLILNYLSTEKGKVP